MQVHLIFAMPASLVRIRGDHDPTQEASSLSQRSVINWLVATLEGT